jgi:uncharacterized protein (TIGR02588 family)
MKHLEKNWLEWCVFGAGSVLVLVTIGYLVYEEVTNPERPAVMEVRVGPAESRSGEFAVPVTVVNRGDEGAEAVLVEVHLQKRGGDTKRAELQIQLLPGRSTREGYVFFEGEWAATDRIDARVVGFERP